jgi:predicted nucleotidyltransferase
MTKREELLKKVEKVLQKFQNNSNIVGIAIFGSILSEERFRDDSDIDILVFVKKDLSFEDILRISSDIKKELEKITDRRIEVHFNVFFDIIKFEPLKFVFIKNPKILHFWKPYLKTIDDLKRRRIIKLFLRSSL